MKFEKKNILAHRGCWKRYSSKDKNSSRALFKALEMGFGIETDIRFYKSNLIISHDQFIESKSFPNILYLDNLLDFYKSNNCKGLLALNIKEDGMSEYLYQKLNKYDINNYFVFDASVPELVNLSNVLEHVYTRESEYEDSLMTNSLKIAGVWIDSFTGNLDYFLKIKKCQNFFKNIALVSPELHSRPHKDLWKKLLRYKLELYPLSMLEKVMICTDFPEELYNFMDEF
tara:strand:- start:516 stop:1202 length:687 start_codon:yes stop_codon:yes gene_type:complete